jgi:hypothetical protein
VHPVFSAVFVMALAACGADQTCFSEDPAAPVAVELINADTGRFISGATVRAGDVELMETTRGQYEIWSNVQSLTVTATHPEYYDVEGTLAPSSCAGLRAIVGMDRKSPCKSDIAGVRVTALDAADETPVSGAVIELADGSYVERMVETSPGVYEGAFDRPGVYQVQARASGYADAIEDQVWVAEDDCSVLTAAVILDFDRS